MFWINELRFLAAVAVIILHVSASYIPSLGGNDYSLFIINLYESSVRWSVPIFVIITGFLLNDDKPVNLSIFYQKRVKRILLPLLFWSIFYLIWIFAKTIILNREHNLTDIFISILEGKPYYHLWYLYMIIGIYFFAPLMNLVVNKLDEKNVFPFVLVMFVMSFFSVLQDLFIEKEKTIFIFMFLKFIPFYMFGALYKNNTDIRFKWITSRLTIPICFLGIFMSFLILNKLWGIDVAFIAYSYNNPLVVIMSLSLFTMFKLRSKPRLSGKIFDLGNSKALGIYLIHPVFLDLFNYLGAFDTSFLLALAIPLFSLLAFGFSLFFCFLLSKLVWFNKLV